MKHACTLFLIVSSAFAQTAAKPAPPAGPAATTKSRATTHAAGAATHAAGAATHAAGAATHAAGAATHPCDKLPEISAKVPALPAGAPCARSLYVVTTVPSINLDYVSPLESPDLRATLGIDSVKFSLDYIDTKMGTGPVAAPHMWYTVNYTGYLLDGTKFDSNADHPGGAPFSFPYGQHHVIAGWDTGLDGMRVGGKRRLFVPWELAYGPNGKPPTIPAKAELIFDIELLSQSEKDPTPQPAAAKPAAPTPTPQKTPAASASPAPPAGPAAAPAVPPAASAPAATPAPATPPK